MLHLKQDDRELKVEILDYEYPPGWGAGTKYDTDYLICRICGRDGEEFFEEEDSFFRFEELSNIYDECLRILDGDSYGFEATIEDRRLGFYVEIEDGFLSVNFSFVRDELFSVAEVQNPVEFQKMTQEIFEELRKML